MSAMSQLLCQFRPMPGIETYSESLVGVAIFSAIGIVGERHFAVSRCDEVASRVAVGGRRSAVGRVSVYFWGNLSILDLAGIVGC